MLISKYFSFSLFDIYFRYLLEYTDKYRTDSMDDDDEDGTASSSMFVEHIIPNVQIEKKFLIFSNFLNRKKSKLIM